MGNWQLAVPALGSGGDVSSWQSSELPLGDVIPQSPAPQRPEFGSTALGDPLKKEQLLSP